VNPLAAIPSAVLGSVLLIAQPQVLDGQTAKLPAPERAVSVSRAVSTSGVEDTTSLFFKDSDLRDIYRAISLQHGVNVFLDNGINKRVTVALNRVRVVDAITFLAGQYGLEVQCEGGIFRITQPPPPSPPQPPPPRVPGILFENGLLSVDLKGDDLEKVILLIQERSLSIGMRQNIFWFSHHDRQV
jgi:hypothetical protein